MNTHLFPTDATPLSVAVLVPPMLGARVLAVERLGHHLAEGRLVESRTIHLVGGGEESE